jgi:hypothetical protein
MIMKKKVEVDGDSVVIIINNGWWWWLLSRDRGRSQAS